METERPDEAPGRPPRRKLVLFTSLPKVGGHSALTFGLCRLLKPYFGTIEVWCKAMPGHGHSEPLAKKLEELGCEVHLLSGPDGKLIPSRLARFFFRSLRRPPDVFFVIAMRHLSPLLALLSRAPRRIYYQITHDLKTRTIRTLRAYARVFSRIVFICPATFEDFPGASDDRNKYCWIPQSSEIPVTNRDRLAAEREGMIVANPANTSSFAENCGIGILPVFGAISHGQDAHATILTTSPNPPVRFGLIGRLTVEKGAGVILDFARTSGVDCEFHVAGSGPMEPAFRELAGRTDQPGLPAVRFHGAFDPSHREEFLRSFFSGIDYLIVPSQDEWETLSMAALEALQHGVPAVICRTGGLKSFAHPDLGPAPESVVRLVEPDSLPATLAALSRQPPPCWDPSGRTCLGHYDRHFSDQALLSRWLDVLIA